MRGFRRVVAMAFMGAVGALGLAAAAWACSPGQRYVSTSPVSGPAGIGIRVSGANFASGVPIEFKVQRSDETAVTDWVFTPAQGPSFSVKATIPASTPPAVYYLAASQPNGSATTSFTVTREGVSASQTYEQGSSDPATTGGSTSGASAPPNYDGSTDSSGFPTSAPPPPSPSAPEGPVANGSLNTGGPGQVSPSTSGRSDASGANSSSPPVYQPLNPSPVVTGRSTTPERATVSPVGAEPVTGTIQVPGAPVSGAPVSGAPVSGAPVSGAPAQFTAPASPAGSFAAPAAVPSATNPSGPVSPGQSAALPSPLTGAPLAQPVADSSPAPSGAVSAPSTAAEPQPAAVLPPLLQVPQAGPAPEIVAHPGNIPVAPVDGPPAAIITAEPTLPSASPLALTPDPVIEEPQLSPVPSLRSVSGDLWGGFEAGISRQAIGLGGAPGAVTQRNDLTVAYGLLGLALAGLLGAFGVAEVARRERLRVLASNPRS